MCGVEYFAHPWEFGPRKAKELLLTGDSLDVDEAHRLGMVSKVFPPSELAERTLEFARRIAKLPTMAALLIKESVNQTVDNMGFYNALNACFTLHQLNHSHWAEINEDSYPVGTPRVRRPALERGPARAGCTQRDGLIRHAAVGAAAGQSMQAYLLGELSKLAERPSMAEIVARAQARARATGSTVTMNDAVAAVRAARDRPEP